jgi:hypothetical protein
VPTVLLAPLDPQEDLAFQDLYYQSRKGEDEIPRKAVEAWIAERLGPTVQSRRRTMQKIFADP